MNAMQSNHRMHTRWLPIVACAVALAAAPAWAQPENSLEKCQKEAAKRSQKFADSVVKVMAKCFQSASKNLIKENDADVSGAAKTCSSQLRKLLNTTTPSKTLYQKTKAKIDKRCNSASNPHTTNQVLSTAPIGVAEGIEAQRLNAYCISFGGDGDLDSVEEWIDCQLSAALCHARQEIGTLFPRALEWIPDLEIAVTALGPDQKFLDATQALDELQFALDGNNDLAIDLNCGPGITDCGNGVVDIDEQCDGVQLNGETCATLGFANGGDLTCSGNCAFDLNSCFSGTFSKTGQTLSVQAGDDGDIQAGPEFSYTDNGDGTITDNNTGFTWEKMSDDGSIHDINNLYNWADAFAVHIATLNSTNFGGHNDWRLPNRHELQSLVNAGVATPAVSPEFNDDCVVGCSILECSCTVDNPHWTSTTHVTSNSTAWVVIFEQGISNTQAKTATRKVRAVRGP